MAEEAIKSLSLTDQILENLFLSLENQDGYDSNLIGALRNLARHGDLTKSAKISNVLKTIGGGEDAIG